MQFCLFDSFSNSPSCFLLFLDRSISEDVAFAPDGGTGRSIPSREGAGGNGNASVTCAVLGRRLQKAITANTKWQQKYEIETRVSRSIRQARFRLSDLFFPTTNVRYCSMYVL